MKEAFDEAYVAEGLDPLDGAPQTFDWDMLYRRLAEDASTGDMDKQLALGAAHRPLQPVHWMA